MQIYGFAFGRNLSASVLWRLKNIDCCYQIFPNNLDRYLQMLLHDQPEYILGLGVYSGVDQDKIRIETKCSNQFRNDFIKGNEFEEILISPYLKPSILTKYAEGIGNSYCNMVSWQIMQLILQKKLRSQYTFLHIPKSLGTITLVKEIDSLLGVVHNIF